jgi:hypothetical protein
MPSLTGVPASFGIAPPVPSVETTTEPALAVLANAAIAKKDKDLEVLVYIRFMIILLLEGMGGERAVAVRRLHERHAWSSRLRNRWVSILSRRTNRVAVRVGDSARTSATTSSSRRSCIAVDRHRNEKHAGREEILAASVFVAFRTPPTYVDGVLRITGPR